MDHLSLKAKALFTTSLICMASVDQDRTAQKVLTGLWSTLCSLFPQIF